MNDLALVPDEIIVAPTLAECEEVIRRGVHSFVEVGQALVTIRERQSYKEVGFDTFEDYCDQRWGFTRMRASQFIASSDVVKNSLQPRGLPVPTNEAQAYELRDLRDDPDQLAEAWSEVIETAKKAKKQPTAKLVKQIVAKFLKPDKDDDDEPADGMPCYGCGKPILVFDMNDKLRPVKGQGSDGFDDYYQFGQGWIRQKGWPNASNHVKGIKWADRFVHKDCLDSVLINRKENE